MLPRSLLFCRGVSTLAPTIPSVMARFDAFRSPSPSVTLVQLKALTEELLTTEPTSTVVLAPLEALVRPHAESFRAYIQEKYQFLYASKRLAAILAQRSLGEPVEPAALTPFILLQPQLVLDHLRSVYPDKTLELGAVLHQTHTLSETTVTVLETLIRSHFYPLGELLHSAFKAVGSPEVIYNLSVMTLLQQEQGAQAFGLINDALVERVALDRNLMETFFAATVRTNQKAAFQLLLLLHRHGLGHLSAASLNRFLSQAARANDFEQVLWVWNHCVEPGYTSVENGTLMALARVAHHFGKATFLKSVYRYYIDRQPSPPSFVAAAIDVSENLLELYTFKKEVLVYRVEDAAKWENHRSVFKVFNQGYHELPRNVRETLRVADFPRFVGLLASRYKNKYYEKTYGAVLEDVLSQRWRMARIMFNLNLVGLIKANQLHHAIDLLRNLRELPWIRVNSETFFYLFKACELHAKDDLFFAVVDLKRKAFRAIKLDYNTYMVLFRHLLRNDSLLCDVFLKEFKENGFTVDSYMESVFAAQPSLLDPYR